METPLGSYKANVYNTANRKAYRLLFLLVQSAPTAILGAQACQETDLLMVRTTSHKQSCLKLSKLKEAVWLPRWNWKMYSRNIQTSLVTSSAHSKRMMFPICLKEDLRRKLDRVEESGVLQKVLEPTKWVSSMVIERKKDGSMLLCIDSKHLNKASLRPQYLSPVIDDILPELAGARVFSVADARNRFWHVRLDEEGSLLTTITTPYGGFGWTRMPFGISPAPEIFQQTLEEALAGLDGVRPVADEILVCGEGKTLEAAVENHDERFRALLERSRETGLRLHRGKRKNRLSEVPYVGHLSDQGLKVHPLS